MVEEQLLTCRVDGQISSANGGACYKTNYTVQRKTAAPMPNQQLLIIATSKPELLIYRTSSEALL